MMKVIKISLGALWVLGLSFMSLEAETATTKKSFESKKLQILSTRSRRSQPYFENLTEELKKANYSITIYQYLIFGQSFNDEVQTIFKILEERSLEGVDVNLYLSGSRKKKFSEKPVNAELKNEFGTAPVDVNILPDERSLHSKVAIIDTKTVFVGSENWTPSGLRKNIGYTVMVNDTGLARNLRKNLKESLVEYWPDFFNKEPNPKEKKTSQVLKKNSLDLEDVTKEELTSIKGIGPTYAERIIRYRKENRFVDVEDLVEVSGIGASRVKTLEKYLKD